MCCCDHVCVSNVPLLFSESHQIKRLMHAHDNKHNAHTDQLASNATVNIATICSRLVSCVKLMREVGADALHFTHSTIDPMSPLFTLAVL